MTRRNKLKLVWPLLLLLSLILFCGACFNPTAMIEGLIPLVGAILAIAGTVAEGLLPAEASLIGAAMALVTNGLNALLAALKSYDANKTGTGSLADLQAAFNAVHTNLTQLLAAAQVKNPLVAQKITGVINGIISVVATVEAYIVSKHPPTSASS